MGTIRLPTPLVLEWMARKTPLGAAMGMNDLATPSYAVSLLTLIGNPSSKASLMSA